MVQKLKFGGKEFIVKFIKKVPDTSPYAKLINDNTIYIDYLLANFSKAMDNKELLKIKKNKLKRYANVFTEEKIKALGL